ncbi:hypothetical protein EYZ11_007416 [Aspergillus tanneri]|uniref:Uncharacterized protein n=1 Tax=Aspergillus tanneri TaxID=1220188 RepID=A0A4V3UNZ8_9EURO|nr:hypothetical protein EYZ11_007416 [Aspergillus tanneri]
MPLVSVDRSRGGKDLCYSCYRALP